MFLPFQQRTFPKSSPKDIEKSSPTSDTLRSPIYKKMTVLNIGLCPAKQIRIVKNVVENERTKNYTLTPSLSSLVSNLH